MLEQIRKKIRDRDAILVTGAGSYSLSDTMECGQCFRWQKICDEPGYVEYMIPVGEKLFFVGQEKPGELIFYGISDEDFKSLAIPFFSLDTDYEKIKDDIRLIIVA